ncbi:Protein of unknown function [Pyronema omphalodes CBS 100304]|uniref:Uncharacterized protein n=1 Tax=Pyronema omphalodes (strain CBS 100304) TaxID=1076935 RepID=U4KWS9_PYROM|nr:Protein of unknown function [Pyronema omphalodes CBS 100304]
MLHCIIPESNPMPRLLRSWPSLVGKALSTPALSSLGGQTRSI